ncbi:hypothetical protein [Streptomyces sp. JB150]|uniref:hypothetical protein n=1 Tax=Streptomyces sp. JB150 TaxID=2714844 RepID=UPI00140D8FC7|nr:hypothetical protein [Streptomyces sp. JB150]QIJ64440.1 hypothetical protein G7Z13_22340 [Streptomyces sp. JB150]
MGLFSRRGTSSRAGSAAPSLLLGSGRKLTSSLALGDSVQCVEELMDGYRDRKYAALPHLVPAGHLWHGAAQEAPAAVYASADQAGDFVLFAFGRGGTGTRIGVFPLGFGSKRLNTPLIGHLKTRDPSLSSVGAFPEGVVSLTAPTVPPTLVEDTLTAAAYPHTAGNLARVADRLFTMAATKGYQFVSGMESEAAARRRSAAWQRRAENSATLVEPVQLVLDDLASWQPGVLPYIQDLPLRVQSVLLEAVGLEGSFWEALERR